MIALAAARAGETSLAEKSAGEYDRRPTSSCGCRALPSGRPRRHRDGPRETLRRRSNICARSMAIQHGFANDPSSLVDDACLFARAAYLQLRQGKEAASELQRLIDHPESS